MYRANEIYSGLYCSTDGNCPVIEPLECGPFEGDGFMIYDDRSIDRGTDHEIILDNCRGESMQIGHRDLDTMIALIVGDTIDPAIKTLDGYAVQRMATEEVDPDIIVIAAQDPHGTEVARIKFDALSVYTLSTKLRGPIEMRY